jgi:hypothetical protein
VITPSNRVEVLPRFFHASKQEARAVAAEISPQAAIPRREVVTVVAPPAARALAPAIPSAVRQVGAEVRPEELALAAPAIASPRTVAEPLTADLRRLHVTVSKQFMAKLEAAKDALSHSHPGSDVEAILEAGLDALLDRAAKRKGLVERPRRSSPPAVADAGDGNSRYVPAAVRREVWRRDEGRCQWATADGGICGSTYRCELDHVVPFARGGKPTVDGLRVLCRVHNDLAARNTYGDAWMDRFTGGSRTGTRRNDRCGEARSA